MDILKSIYTSVILFNIPLVITACFLWISSVKFNQRVINTIDFTIFNDDFVLLSNYEMGLFHRRVLLYGAIHVKSCSDIFIRSQNIVMYMNGDIYPKNILMIVDPAHDKTYGTFDNRMEIIEQAFNRLNNYKININPITWLTNYLNLYEYTRNDTYALVSKCIMCRIPPDYSVVTVMEEDLIKHSIYKDEYLPVFILIDF